VVLYSWASVITRWVPWIEQTIDVRGMEGKKSFFFVVLAWCCPRFLSGLADTQSMMFDQRRIYPPKSGTKLSVLIGLFDGAFLRVSVRVSLIMVDTPIVPVGAGCLVAVYVTVWLCGNVFLSLFASLLFLLFRFPSLLRPA
jgi:hypothetical protein